MLTIEAQVFGETIVLLQSPTLATNTVETAEVAFSFDEEWDGFVKTAMFWGADDEEYSVEVIGNKAVIPREAMAETGKMKLGVYGVNGNKRIVTMKIPYTIAEGAYYRPQNN